MPHKSLKTKINLNIPTKNIRSKNKKLSTKNSAFMGDFF